MRLLIALAAALCLPGAAQAYSHSVRNISKETIRFWVNYKACSNDTWTLRPGELVTFRSGLCCITNTNAQLDAGARSTSGGTKGPGEDIIRQITFMTDITCGNTNWTVDGEKKGVEDSIGVVIKRI